MTSRPVRGAGRAGAAAAGLAIGCLAYGTLIERRWYRLRRLALPGLLRGPGRLRVLHVSDIHLVPGQDHRVRFLAQLGELDHDLVVVTGDTLGASGAEHEAVAALAPLTAGGRPGLMVLGSNDRFGPVPKSPLDYLLHPERRVTGDRLDTAELVDGLAGVGYHTLDASTVVLDTPAGSVAAGGIDDPHLGASVIPEPRAVTPAADGALVHLGLVHAPYRAALDVLVDAGSDLLLAGHTHGGQVRLPGVGALVANCDLPLSQVRGASRYRDRHLHVSAGLGHSRYAPVRFACRPEATLLELS